MEYLVTKQAILESRTICSGDTKEIYITAAPQHGRDPSTQVRRVFASVRDELKAQDARIFYERLIATREMMPFVNLVRAEIYQELDDGVPPTRLIAPPSLNGEFIGVQLHAVAGRFSPRPIRCWNSTGVAAGRLLRSDHRAWIFINNLAVAGTDRSADAARRMFFCAGCLLRQAGATMQSVARTWLWLPDVVSWYEDLNRERNSFFERECLIDHHRGFRRLPASTGVGITTHNCAGCAMELIAMPGSEEQIKFIETGVEQPSAYKYGSAFSRAAIAPMPAGLTIFVSGTAAIDARGATRHIGRAGAQIDETLAHVHSLLRRQGCDNEDVVSALVYCKTAEVERAFRRRAADISWPRLTMTADLCRPELLFEVEVTAICPKSGPLSPRLHSSREAALQ